MDFKYFLLIFSGTIAFFAYQLSRENEVKAKSVEDEPGFVNAVTDLLRVFATSHEFEFVGALVFSGFIWEYLSDWALDNLGIHFKGGKLPHDIRDRVFADTFQYTENVNTFDLKVKKNKVDDTSVEMINRWNKYIVKADKLKWLLYPLGGFITALVLNIYILSKFG